MTQKIENTTTSKVEKFLPQIDIVEKLLKYCVQQRDKAEGEELERLNAMVEPFKINTVVTCWGVSDIDNLLQNRIEENENENLTMTTEDKQAVLDDFFMEYETTEEDWNALEESTRAKLETTNS